MELYFDRAEDLPPKTVLLMLCSIRDVQCISCDKNVVMKMEDTNKFKVEPLPCSMSMKPYLTYELDQVRKQHRRLPHSRNMIQFEAAMQEESKRQKSARSDTLVKTPR